MDRKIEEIVNLTEKLVKQIERRVLPAVELLEDLKVLIADIRREHGLSAPVINANP